MVRILYSENAFVRPDPILRENRSTGEEARTL